VTGAVTCGKCGTSLDEPSDLPVHARRPCEACGATIRRHEVSLEDSLTLKSSTSSKLQRGGKGRPVVEAFGGDDLTVSTGRWIHRDRLIDHESDRYRERVFDPQTGEVIRDVDERLSDHRGHGSAKSGRTGDHR